MMADGDRADNNPVPFDSIFKLKDVFGTILNMCHPIEIFRMSLVCKENLDGRCWSHIKHLDSAQLRSALLRADNEYSLAFKKNVAKWVDLIRNNAQSVRSIHIYQVPEKEDLLAPLFDYLLPQVTSASFSSWLLPSYDVIRLQTQLQALRVDSLSFLSLPNLPSLNLPSFDLFCRLHLGKLNHLRISIFRVSFVALMRHIASNLKNLESLSLNVEYSTFGDYDKGRSELMALSEAALANRALKRLDMPFIYEHYDVMFEIFESRGYRQGLWDRLDELIREFFGVCLLGFRPDGQSIWQHLLLGEYGANIAPYDRLFELCYGPVMTVEAVEALCEAVERAATDPLASAEYILSKVDGWLAESWAWTQYHIYVVLPLISQLVQNAVVAVGLEGIDAHISCIHKIANSTREICRLHKCQLWSADAPLVIHEVKPVFLSLLHHFDSKWIEGMVNLEHQLMCSVYTYAYNQRAFDIILHFSGPMLCRYPRVFMHKLDRDTGIPAVLGLQKYLQLFRKNPEFLPLLVEQASDRLALCFNNIYGLGCLLSAFVVDEKMLSALLMQHREIISLDVIHYAMNQPNMLLPQHDATTIVSAEEARRIESNLSKVKLTKNWPTNDDRSLYLRLLTGLSVVLIGLVYMYLDI